MHTNMVGRMGSGSAGALPYQRYLSEPDTCVFSEGGVHSCSRTIVNLCPPLNSLTNKLPLVNFNAKRMHSGIGWRRMGPFRQRKEDTICMSR